MCVAFLYRFGDSFSYGSPGAAIWVSPSQPVLFAPCTDNSLRVLIDAGIIVNGRSVLLLSFNISTTNFDRIQFVRSDLLVQNLVTRGLCIEVPLRAFLGSARWGAASLFTYHESCVARVLRIDLH